MTAAAGLLCVVRYKGIVASLEASVSNVLSNGLSFLRLKAMVNILLTSKGSGGRLQPNPLGNPTQRLIFLDLKASSVSSASTKELSRVISATAAKPQDNRALPSAGFSSAAVWMASLLLSLC